MEYQDVINLGMDSEEDSYMELADLIVDPSGKAMPVNKSAKQTTLGRLPLPPGLKFKSMNFPMASDRVAKAPKKPGAMTPFILFSQEHREEVLSVHKNLRFGEVGKKMGELWHALSEEEKEEYRSKARLCGEKKLKEWQEKMKDFPPQQQQQEYAPVAAAKPRRTHGYAIFSAEMRKKLNSNMLMCDKTKIIAEKWRNAPPAVREVYDSKAARINQTEVIRGQQMLFQAQRNQLQFQQRQQQQQQQLQMRHRRGFPRGPGRPSLQHAQGLKISSMSSLKHNQSLPTRGVNIPSSITISRIEPELSIREQVASVNMHNLPPGLSIQRMRGPPALTRNGPVGFQRRGQNMIQQNQTHQYQEQLAFRQPNQNQMMRQIRPMGNPGVFGVQRNVVLKRPLQSGLMSGIPNKQPRMILPPLLKPAQMPGQAIGKAKICRLCAQYSPFSFPLKSKPDTLQAIKFALNMSIDFEEDKQNAYPGNVCRRCCTVLTTFSQFKNTYETGQMKLKTIVENKRKSALAATEGDSSDLSILPDLDCEMEKGDTSSVNQDKLFNIVPDRMSESDISIDSKDKLENIDDNEIAKSLVSKSTNSKNDEANRALIKTWSHGNGNKEDHTDEEIEKESNSNMSEMINEVEQSAKEDENEEEPNEQLVNDCEKESKPKTDYGNDENESDQSEPVLTHDVELEHHDEDGLNEEVDLDQDYLENLDDLEQGPDEEDLEQGHDVEDLEQGQDEEDVEQAHDETDHEQGHNETDCEDHSEEENNDFYISEAPDTEEQDEVEHYETAKDESGGEEAGNDEDVLDNEDHIEEDLDESLEECSSNSSQIGEK